MCIPFWPSPVFLDDSACPACLMRCGRGQVSDGRGTCRLKHAHQECKVEKITKERCELLDFTVVFSAVLAGVRFFRCCVLLRSICMNSLLVCNFLFRTSTKSTKKLLLLKV